MLEIYKAERADIQELIPSFIPAFSDSEWQQNWTEASAEACLSEIFDFPHFYGLLARKDGRTAGAILGHIHSFNNIRSFYIDELFVAPSFRRQGIAKALYRQAIDALKEAGVAGAFFTTLRNSSAYDFYVSQGAVDLRNGAVFYHPFSE